MNRNRIAAILIVFACALGVGAYFLVTGSPSDGPAHREAVTPPSTEDAKAPTWVDTGQTPTPDYSSATTEAHNATPVPTPQKNPQVIEVSEDRIVTFTFVESLADFFLNRFIPQGANGSPASLASAKSLNMYYGQEMDGFSIPGDDIRSARKALFNYAFTPAMLQTLSKLYTPVLMAQIIDSATNSEREYSISGTPQRRILSNAETAAMLRLNARQIQQTAQVFRAISTDPSITEMAGKYLRSSKAVKRANEQLQNAIAGNQSTGTASQRLKQAIQQREQVKKTITKRLKQSCRECKDADLFYLAQWAYRRVLSEPDKRLPTFGVAADVMDNLAERFISQAKDLE